MDALLPEMIQQLTEHKSREGSPVLSLYLNFDPSNPINRRGGYKVALDSMLKDLESQIKDESKLKHFQEDAGWVRQQAELLIPKSKSLLLCCDASESFFFQEDLSVRVANQVWYGDTPYVRPLMEARDEYERYGVVLSDREKARFFVISMGLISEVSDILQEPPVKHRSAAGSDHMRSQMIFQRRAAKWRQNFLEDVAERLYDIMSEYGIDRILLAGPEDVTAELQRMLPKAVLAKVVDRLRIPLTAKPHDVLSVALPAIQTIEREQEEFLVEDLTTTALKTGPNVKKAVVGYAETLDAVNQGRVHRLVYPLGMQIRGFQCAACDVLLDHAPADGMCPYCSKPLDEVEDMVWMASERVLASGGKAEEIRSSGAAGRLQGMGGMGAYLR